MNRLFLTLATVLLLALAASLASSWWLSENPLLRADDPAIAKRLERIGIELQQSLAPLPERQWDDIVSATGYDDYYDIDWYSAEEYAAPIETRTELLAQLRVLSYEWDDSPLYEILFNEQQLVLQIVPRDTARRTLNSAINALAILAIGILATVIALFPVARRLQKLQRLANEYGKGNWDASPVDNANDAIGKLAASMQDMADRIQRLVTEKNTLASDQRNLMQAVAHEFRGPMARMRFALELAGDKGIDDQNRHELNQALDELNEMINEVLAYARLQINAPDLSFKSVLLSELIKDTCHKHQFIAKDSHISVDVQPDETPVQADATQIQRAIYNLVGNALKYGGDYAKVSLNSDGETATIHVDDRGPGIPIEDRQRALKPFVRLDSSRSRQLGGSGLGLAIAHSVAQKHGGELVITDRPDGVGARLSLTLPVRQLDA
ncbi:hypothetical protein AB833_11645 [Chromatiales bacterium (ex Bugula neritina AB1)]|nr:hypothetical protein AB833_11645 [Chromatiales bacterium (ex Bugula neritina AB1)]